MDHLKFALEAVCMDELENLPGEKELSHLIPLSKEFEKRMTRLLRSRGQASPNRKIRSMILIAILAALMTSIMSIQAVREPIAGFLLDIYERCTDIIFQTEPVDQQGEKQFVIPDVPSGYTEISREEYKALVRAEYHSERGCTMSYTQYRLEGSSLSVDTEDADTDIEEILGYQVFLYSNKGWNSMIWTDGVFAYELNANCGIPELRTIAETIMGKLG